MLELDGVALDQGDFHLTANFSLPRHSRTALIGPSGAGKSTLLAAISGFLPETSGRILIDGGDQADLPPGKRPLSVVFQDGNLFPHMTVAQNVGLGLRPDLRLTAPDHAVVLAALARVGLGDFAGRKPGALSGGQQSRVVLARVLVQRQPLILLDEPFAALGPAQRTGMLDLVADLCDEIAATLVMVTHDPADARRLCDLTVVVADGLAATPAPTAQTLDTPPPALAAYLGVPVR